MEQIVLKRTNSADPDFQLLIKQLDTDLRQRNGDAMDDYDPYNIISHIETVIIAYLDDIPKGCGCFKKYNDNTVEIKRMFVHPSARGKRISALILNELEVWAGELGFAYAILETGAKQVEALGLYHRTGYARIANYSPYEDMDDSFCFRKELKK